MRANSKKSDLVANRVCGECVVCCHSLPIETNDLVKLPNVNCQHLKKGGGCGIYQTRPELCKSWFCAWRHTKELGNNMRPDKIGVLIEGCRENFPGVFAGKSGFRFAILDHKKALSSKDFINFVYKNISEWVPCILAYGPKAGQVPSSAFLNAALHKAVAKKDKKAIRKELEKAINACKNLPEETMEIKDGHLVSNAFD